MNGTTRSRAVSAILLLIAGVATTAAEQGKPSEPPEDAMPPAGAALARALDKVTARITELRLPISEEVRFGTLVILARQCVSRPPEETPESAAFLQIDEETDAGRARIFSGWMFASSPALNPLEHPVYDVWIVGCESSGAAG